jgi:hypothetical protein
MDLPDLTGLAEVGGWVFSSAVLSGVLWLIVTGKLVAGPSHSREATRADKQDDRLDKLTDAVKDSSGVLRTVLALLESRQRGTD